MFLVRIEVDSKKSSYTSFHGWPGSWPWIHIMARISSFGEFLLAKKSSKGCQLSSIHHAMTPNITIATYSGFRNGCSRASHVPPSH